MRRTFLAVAFCLTMAGCSPAPAVVVDAASVASGLKAKALPIGAVTVFDAATDPNKLMGRPNQYTSKVNFVDTRYPLTDPSAIPDNTVEVYTTVEDATARQEYVAAIAKSAPVFAQYIYREGRIIVRLQSEILPEQAAQYETALKAAP